VLVFNTLLIEWGIKVFKLNSAMVTAMAIKS
jgi:hypothetical protein